MDSISNVWCDVAPSCSCVRRHFCTLWGSFHLPCVCRAPQSLCRFRVFCKSRKIAIVPNFHFQSMCSCTHTHTHRPIHKFRNAPQINVSIASGKVRFRSCGSDRHTMSHGANIIKTMKIKQENKNKCSSTFRTLQTTRSRSFPH